MKNPSLLPFLDSRSAFYLDFLAAPGSPDDRAGNPYPFRILDDSDPVARLVQADLRVLSGEIIKRVFVLIQKDHYLLPRDSLSTTANPDIDEAWRKAALFYRAGDNGVATFARPAGVGDPQIEPFQPLLFCKKKRLLFHPVCPRCGESLELCTDDEGLAKEGLASFSRSLTRYLTCSSETCGGRSDFYVYERLPGDSPRVRDWRDLVREYADLREPAAESSGFPCGGCTERQVCFDPASQGKASERITPFSFYPFHMLVFDAMTADALHFSALLSGADRRQVALSLRAEQAHGQADWLERHKGPKEKGFLFSDDPRFFAEVLYLKLALLSEIIRAVPDEGYPPEPGFRLSIDRIWIKTTEQNSLLPSFWTFTVLPLDIFRSFSGGRKGSKLIARSDPYHLAIIWFSVLAANEHRSPADISREIRESIVSDALSSDFPSDRAEGKGHVIGPFPPSDIFWNQSGAHGGISHKPYLELWERAMGLGRYLVAASTEDETSWSREVFLKGVDALRGEIRGELFASAPPADEQGEIAPVDDGAIRAVLDDIIAGWRLKEKEEQTSRVQVRETEPTPPVEIMEEEEESLETIIIGPAHTQTVTGPAPAPAGDELAETVIISAKKPQEEPEPVAPPAKPPEEELEATVIIGPGSNTAASQGTAVEPRREELQPRTGTDELEETVIISSQGAREMFAPVKQDKGLGEEILEETVIISRRVDAGSPETPETPKKEPAKPVEDDMEATLIMTRPKPGPGEKG